MARLSISIPGEYLRGRRICQHTTVWSSQQCRARLSTMPSPPRWSFHISGRRMEVDVPARLRSNSLDVVVSAALGGAVLVGEGSYRCGRAQADLGGFQPTSLAIADDLLRSAGPFPESAIIRRLSRRPMEHRVTCEPVTSAPRDGDEVQFGLPHQYSNSSPLDCFSSS